MKNLLTLLLVAGIPFSVFADNNNPKDNNPNCTATITISPGNSTICLGSSITLTAAGGVSYTWSDGETTTAITVSPQSSTNYTVNGTDNSGCTGSFMVTIAVDNPNLSASSSSNLICPGANTTLSATADGGISPFTYAWSPSNWLTCTNCSSPTANPPGTINYNVTTIDGNGCSSSASVTVNVDNMYIGTNVTPQTPCFGASVILNAIVQGGSSPYTYLWMPGVATTATCTVVANSATGATYSITATDLNGCSASATANVNPDNFSVSLPPSTTICSNSGSASGAPSGLYAQIQGGTQPFTYNWSTGNTSPFLPFQGLTSGIYSVTVTDANNCSATAIDTLTVNPSPNIIITSTKNPIQIGWADTLTVTGGNGYIWSDGSTTTQIIVRPRISTEYSVIGWNNYCASSVGITVIVSRDYFLPSPDTLIPHQPGFPPIYYNGNISIGGDSAYSPTQALQVHGSATIDSNLMVKGNIITNRITMNDTLTVPNILVSRIRSLPGDSGVHIGDSSLFFNNTTNNLYGTYGGVGIGYNTYKPEPTSIAIGILNTVTGKSSVSIGSNNAISGYNSYILGSGLTNSIMGSIMMGGYNSNNHTPAISIIPDMTNGTYGFVGIGTTAPFAQFQVNFLGSGWQIGNNSISMGAMGDQPCTPQNIYPWSYIGFNAARSKYGGWAFGTDGGSTGNDGGVVICNDAQGDLNFVNIHSSNAGYQEIPNDNTLLGSITMSLNANGYLGLGTSAPTSALNINENLNQYSVNTPVFSITDALTNTNNSTPNVATIDQNGNTLLTGMLGVGTMNNFVSNTSPMLEIDDGLYTNPSAFTHNSGCLLIKYDLGTDPGDALDLVDINTNNEIFNIDNKGNSFLQGDLVVVNSNATTEWSYGIKDIINSNNSQYIKAFAVSDQKTGNDIFDIYSSGNVNIMTQYNGYPLNVGGTIWCSEIRVCLTGCDFVFDKEYNLMPLKDLEGYLNQNHHLPGIPSAKEMETTDGVELGKMNSKLLQKVEELTLYTIELKKQLDEMQAEIARMKENK